jgi:hypothetical protein
VWVEEWRIGDWGRPGPRLGDLVDWGLDRPSPEDLDWLTEIIGAEWTETITHEIDDAPPVAAVSLAGRVVAIDQIRAAYPDAHGGSPIPGSGVLQSVSEATLMGDGPGPDGLVIMGYLIDVSDDEDARHMSGKSGLRGSGPSGVIGDPIG